MGTFDDIFEDDGVPTPADNEFYDDTPTEEKTEERLILFEIPPDDLFDDD